MLNYINVHLKMRTQVLLLPLKLGKTSITSPLLEIEMSVIGSLLSNTIYKIGLTQLNIELYSHMEDGI